jgi:predicted rRNA methylase YqxC with S4 and FtsJ domains
LPFELFFSKKNDKYYKLFTYPTNATIYEDYIIKDTVDTIILKASSTNGKENIAKGGIVKNKSLYPVVIDRVKEAARLNNLMFKDHIESPILGGDGNMEFLMLLEKMN